MNCPLCVTYHYYPKEGCGKCPLCKAYDQHYGCLNFVDDILKTKRKETFISLSIDSVSYCQKEGENQIKKIHRFLSKNFE